MYNVAIFDDESVIQEKVIDILKMYFEDMFNYITAAKAPDLIDSASVIDILIIDINISSKKMPHNGIEIAERIKKNNRDCQVIFISGYSQYAQDIFDAKPVYFVQKPIDEQVMVKAMKVALDNLISSRNQRFSYQKESRVYIVPTEEIMYFESSRRIVKIVRVDGNDSFYDTLNSIEERIEGDFIRIHQSYLVNTRYISSLTGTEIVLHDGRSLPVSKPRLGSVKDELIRVFSENI